jgi:[protein-PII] uridylyltransferase
MSDPIAPADTDRIRARELAARLKQELHDGRAQLKADFLATGRAHLALLHQTDLVDRLLRAAWHGADMEALGVALVAVGGYGRRQQFPYSDVDLLMLLPDVLDDRHRAQIEAFVGMLWDMGMEVGHSIRTIAECLAHGRRDITVQTNLLESRLLAGNAALYERFHTAFLAELDARAFCEAKLLEQQHRHARFNDAAYNLEPNVKENPGGLRDLQVILWIARAARLGATWHELVTHGILSDQEAARLARHESTLHALRTRLHYLAGRREDRLLFDHQTQLARELGFHDTGARRASEQLMQRFYRTTKVVLQLSSVVLEGLRKRISPLPPSLPRPLNARFQIRDGLLETRRGDLYVVEPRAIFETFLLWQQNPEIRGLGVETQRALWHARRLVNAGFRHDAENRALFMRMVRHPTGVTHTLRRLNQFGLLGLYLPAFGRIVGRMQHDLFHVYTVDEHILMVVRNVRRFAVPEMAHEYPLCSRLMSDFERPEVLYLAALFHDIAKGRGGDHSILGRLDALRFCRAHGLEPEDTELVGWLVEHHLALSSTAQKQDLSDPAVVESFARLVGTERRLVALYLLTVADIRGTSPKVWNAWKAKLLEDLFLGARRVIGGGSAPIEGSVEDRKQRALSKLRAYALPEGVHAKLWQELTDSYFLRHDPGEIAWHTRLLNYRVTNPEPIVKARLSPLGEGLQVLIYSPDRINLFAQICSFFEKISFNIVEARVYTTRHGYALDTFQVMEPGVQRTHYRDLISYIEHELRERLERNAPLEPPVLGRVSRQLRAFPLPPEVTVRRDERGRYFYLTLIAGDRPGLLSRVARVLVDYGATVHSAKIDTLGARAEDMFLLSCDALRHERTAIQLQADLIHELQP